MYTIVEAKCIILIHIIRQLFIIRILLNVVWVVCVQ